MKSPLKDSRYGCHGVCGRSAVDVHIKRVTVLIPPRWHNPIGDRYDSKWVARDAGINDRQDRT